MIYVAQEEEALSYFQLFCAISTALRETAHKQLLALPLLSQLGVAMLSS